MSDSKHMKRYAAPRSWSIPRKHNVWTTRSVPGPHSQERSIPLLIALRDILHMGDTAAEVRKILGRREVLVDGKVRVNHKHPVGLMDVISLSKMDKHYRVMINPRGKIALKSIEGPESKWKLARIMNKTMVKGSRMQLNLHDGKNILAKKGEFSTGDVLKLSLPDLKILDRYPMDEDSLALLTSGAHIGTICRIKRIEKTRNPGPNIVEFHEGFMTIVDYAFVVGSKSSEVGSAEVNIL